MFNMTKEAIKKMSRKSPLHPLAVLFIPFGAPVLAVAGFWKEADRFWATFYFILSLMAFYCFCFLFYMFFRPGELQSEKRQRQKSIADLAKERAKGKIDVKDALLMMQGASPDTGKKSLATNANGGEQDG